MVLNKWNPWWVTGKVDKQVLGTKREFRTFLGLAHIKDIIGVRRCGKTTFLMQIIADLLDKNVKPKEIVFVNFDDPSLMSLSFEDIDKEIFSTCPDVKYVFVDEVQQKKGWELWLRVNYDLKKIKQIFVTGSSSSLITKEIGRALTGRHVTIPFFPFSFSEYILQKLKINVLSKDLIISNQDKIFFHFKRFVKNGGFPETFGKEMLLKNLILSNIYADILSRDIASKHGFDFEKLEKIANYLMTTVSNEYSYRKIATKLNIAYETVEKYCETLKDSFLFFDVPLFDYKVSIQQRRNKKIYTIDTGLAVTCGFNFSRGDGILLENLVAIELRRRGLGIYYHKKEKECDFLIKEKTKIVEAIQVCKLLKDEKTRKREIDGLVDAMKVHKLKRGLILTEDGEESFMIDKMKIEVKPIWKWLIGD